MASSIHRDQALTADRAGRTLLVRMSRLLAVFVCLGLLAPDLALAGPCLCDLPSAVGDGGAIADQAPPAPEHACCHGSHSAAAEEQEPAEPPSACSFCRCGMDATAASPQLVEATGGAHGVDLAAINRACAAPIALATRALRLIAPHAAQGPPPDGGLRCAWLQIWRS